MLSKGSIRELARHFNKSHHHRDGKKPKYAMGINHHAEHMKLVEARARKEAEEHRRHRKARREMDQAG